MGEGGELPLPAVILRQCLLSQAKRARWSHFWGPQRKGASSKRLSSRDKSWEVPGHQQGTPCGKWIRIEMTSWPLEEESWRCVGVVLPPEAESGSKGKIALPGTQGPTQCSLETVISESHLSPRGLFSRHLKAPRKSENVLSGPMSSCWASMGSNLRTGTQVPYAVHRTSSHASIT